MSPQPPSRADRPASAPQARTRHGCWTCRKRRRKCDEQKPKCQNCIGKDLKCQYGLQLTFHEANHFKLMPDEAKALSDQAPGRYQRVQFIDGMEDVQEELESSRTEGQARHPDHARSSSLPVDARHDQVCGMPQAPDVVSPHSSTTIDSRFQVPHEEERDYDAIQTDFGSHDLGDVLSQEIFTSHPSFFRTPRTPRNELSSRVEAHTTGQTYSSSFSPVFDPGGERQQSHAFSLPPNRSFPIDSLSSSRGGRESSTSHPTNVMSSHKPHTVQELVKFFIDKVAPWLDLSHADSAFGTQILILSSRFPTLRNAVLALSEAQASKFQHTAIPDKNQSVSQVLGSDMYSRRAEAIIARSLLEIAHLLPHPLRDWRSLLGPHVSYLNDMGVHGFQGDSQRAVAWLILRFDLATAITSQTPILTKLSLWQSSLSESPSPSSHSVLRTTFHLEEALFLCATIADLAFSQTTETRLMPEIWNGFYTRFQIMRDSQSSELLMPILSSHIGSINMSKATPHRRNDSIPIEFPLQIHTSRASFYTSFLHHLALLLLLVSRPIDVDRATSRKLKTTTWHAVQICGLSMSNNILWSWDPIVVAALMHAGQSLSYRAQQMELLRHLRRLEKIIGWKFDGEVDELEDFWKSSS